MSNKYSIILVLVILFCSIAYGAETKASEKERALSALLASEEILQEMKAEGFGVTLINDTLIEAKRAFYGENYSELLKGAENISDEKKMEQAKALLLAAQQVASGSIDYVKVLEKAAAIEEIRDRAYEVRDSVQTLERRIKEVKENTPTIDLKDAEGLLAKANEELANEFYDESENLATQGLDIVRKRQGEATQLKVLYKASQENLVNYLKENWKKVTLTSVIIIFLGSAAFFFGSVFIIRRELGDLNLEREVLISLIKQIQKERFGEGNITQGEYEIKIQKFKERLIDIDKIMPILKARMKDRMFWKKS